MPRLIALLLGAFVLLLPAAASAQQLIGQYRAYLSERDHFNSSGVRLRSAASIIRQDRANYHRFGRRDSADQDDTFFASKTNRANMERMLENGSASRHVLNRIINGTPIIVVKIYGHGTHGTSIVVDVQ